VVLVEVSGPPKQSTSTKTTIRKENRKEKEKRICTNIYYSNDLSIYSYIHLETPFNVSKRN